jgi:hypothetical protein
MEERKEIILSTNTKGIIVFAESEEYDDRWIILINRIEEDDYGGDLRIIRHVSYSIKNKETYSDKNYEGDWGNIEGYKFYKATEEEKQIIKNILKKQNKRFIKIINQVIDK